MCIHAYILFTCNNVRVHEACMYVCTVHWHSPQYQYIFSSSVEMSSLLAEICSRQEAWMEMRTGTFVDPPQTLDPLALTRSSGTNVRLKNIVDCMQWLSYVLCHSCLCVVRRPLVVATTVGEDEETPPPRHHYQCPHFYQGMYMLCNTCKLLISASLFPNSLLQV